VKILADVTAFATDMTTTWMQVEIVINAQNNNDAGANNNVGWNGLGGQNVVRDGQPRTYTWELSDTLTAKIAAADDSIWWFEFALVSNLDGASVTKFYIDNIRLVTPEEAASKGKSTDTIIGNWEQSMDGWGVGGGAAFPATYMAGPAGFGQGLLFNGTGGHQNVELGTFNPSAATGHLTVALWARWNGLTNQWQGLIGKRDGWAVDNMLWDIEINRDTGTIQFRRIDSYPNAGGRVLPIGQWTHIAATFNGTTARFYLNGEETGNGNFSFAQKKDAMLHFGSGDPNGGNAFNGALDDIRLYDKALTAAEVKALLTP